MNCLLVQSNDRMPGKGSKGGQDVQRKDLLRIGLLAFAALLVTGGAKAQDNYPSQMVKVVLPSAPGPMTQRALDIWRTREAETPDP